MLKNVLTSGWLVFDMSDRITTHDEAYAVTTSDKPVGATARSVVHLMRASANNTASNDGTIRYGMEVRI